MVFIESRCIYHNVTKMFQARKKHFSSTPTINGWWTGGYWLDSNSALRLIDGSGNWMERASWLGSSSSSPSPRSSLMWQGCPSTETEVDADKKQPKEQDGCRLDRAPGWGRWIYFVSGTNLVRRWPGKFFLVNMSFDNCLLDVSVQVLLLQLCFNQMSSTQV